MTISVGDTAPAFQLRDQHGSEQSLASRSGERNVLLVFYPFAFTGVCSGEMIELQHHADAWAERGTDVLAVSCDSVPALRAFADTNGLTIPLLSDFWPHGKVAAAYGCFDDTLGASFHNPPLTTIRQPLRKMGALAAEWVLRRITGEASEGGYPEEVGVEPELIARASTGRAPETPKG